MTDRRFQTHSDSRSHGNIKTGTSTNTNTARDDTQTQQTTAGASPGATVANSTNLVPERRQSVFRRLSMSMGSRKSSMMLMPHQNRPNTYRIEPENDFRFRPYRLQPKVLEILIDQLKDKTYQTINQSELVKDLSRNVLQLMKNFPMSRYRLIAHTVIGEKNGQLMRIASRCLWDPKTDNMISVSYETKDMVAVVVIYGVYLD